MLVQRALRLGIKGHWFGSVCGLVGALVLLSDVTIGARGAHAATPSRVVSINACGDQLLLALAERSQIAAVTRYVDEPSMSYFMNDAAGLTRISGAAEEVLKLQPDLVLAGRFTRRETRTRLKSLGVRVELLRPARSLDHVRALIRQVGGLLGREAEAEIRIGQLEQALTGARRAAKGLRVLQLQRRGFVAGQGTLFNAILAHLGGTNAAGGSAIRSVGRVSTEALVKLRPDAVVMFYTDLQAVDQGAALLLHPALRRTLPPDRLITLDMNTMVCGGPQNVVAIRNLERALTGLMPRQ